jgi:hypothetical protein
MELLTRRRGCKARTEPEPRDIAQILIASRTFPRLVAKAVREVATSREDRGSTG